MANEIVMKTLEIIEYLNPTYFILENPPTGLLKKTIVYVRNPFSKILIIASMGCPIEKEPAYGIMCFSGNLEMYVKRIAERFLIINI